MSSLRIAFSRSIFPPVEMKKSAVGLVVRTHGLGRLALFSGVASTILMLLLTLQSSNFRVDATFIFLAPLMMIGVIIANGAVALMWPAETFAIDKTRGTLTVQRTYLGVYQNKRVLNRSEIDAAHVTSEEARDKHGKLLKDGNGTQVFLFHPIVKLASDEIERLTTKQGFEGEVAGSIVEAINDMIGTARNTAPGSPADTLAMEKLNANASAGPSSALCRFLGVMIIGGSLGLLLLLRQDLYSRYDADVVGAVEKCHFSWTISEKVSESQTGECESPPTPKRAKPEAKARVTRGLDLQVAFINSASERISGNVFLPLREGALTRERGRMTIVYRPNWSAPVGIPFPVSMIIGLLLMPIMGITLFFMPRIRAFFLAKGWVGA